MLTVREAQTINYALSILERRRNHSRIFNDPTLFKNYLALKFAHAEGHEEFHVTFLDAQYRLIAHETMALGSLTQSSVYPREVVKRALALNAAAVVLSHNHPSGVLEPSRADELLTQTLKSALQLVDVRVLDHFIIGHDKVLSFAEQGLI